MSWRPRRAATVAAAVGPVAPSPFRAGAGPPDAVGPRNPTSRTTVGSCAVDRLPDAPPSAGAPAREAAEILVRCLRAHTTDPWPERPVHTRLRARTMTITGLAAEPALGASGEGDRPPAPRLRADSLELVDGELVVRTAGSPVVWRFFRPGLAGPVTVEATRVRGRVLGLLPVTVTPGSGPIPRCRSSS
ncbi:hypothetical protein LX15_005175 [Streptoalloteichus tenebrarius]|uniref:Uncharacterized protein n=1 Tax=Streptoalloteichus tenebrarius (strain ATCC 17920 / DSM 40477 / JCM 4838 / CBS 697.72 / NBRC 16177 / NCIMB 11028 / NRRL B-12390 / A12253. 1 / ISP 5477) TaxID=1933 RepID=A0ABT1I0Y9_STRSD|nr:hypothetical protein [Streptoalloteichus tenebrarius]MCP2261449.1 hypothetical protein [Streptoalloteichus tenebrarius]BFE99685.1 hypothetical protein GCM10020241_13610 [Streptoalloteichus tenebrarius]